MASTSSGTSTSAPQAFVITPHQQHAPGATPTTDAPAPSRAGTPQSPRQERASKRAPQRHPPQHHVATGIQGHRTSPAGSGAVPSPTNTGAAGTRPEQLPGTAHPHMDPTPQPQTPAGASTHGHQPAASRSAATQAHAEPDQRHGTPDRPTAGPANAPPQDPPTQTRAATSTDTTITRPSDTVHPQAHNPRLRRHPAQRPRETCRPRHKPNRRPSGTKPHQPGRRYSPQNGHLPVARPPTPSQVQTRQAPPSWRTPRGL